MKYYQFNVETIQVSGIQIFEIQAESSEEALAAIKQGMGRIVAEELEVQSLDWNGAVLSDESDVPTPDNGN